MQWIRARAAETKFPAELKGRMQVMKVPERTARAYLAASNQDDQAAMAEMFAMDATWIPIAPLEEQRGRDAIRRRYLTDVKAMNAPIVEPVYVSNATRGMHRERPWRRW